jgi:hypothetical protein
MAELSISTDRLNSVPKKTAKTRLSGAIKFRKKKHIPESATIPGFPSALGAAAVAGLTILDASLANRTAADVTFAKKANNQTTQLAAQDRSPHIVESEKPVHALPVEKPTWLETLTTDTREQDDAKMLIDEQMSHVRAIAIDPVTEGPSTKFQQTLDYQSNMEAAAKKYDVPVNKLRAIFLVEGWLDDSLMPETARRMGLRVDAKVDERKNPNRYIEGITATLAEQYKLWGENDGIAIAAFNTGAGGMAEIIYEYALAHGGELPVPTNGNIRENSNPYRDYIENNHISLYHLITDPKIDPFRTLIFEIYGPRVAAAEEYMKENGFMGKELVEIIIPIPQQPARERTDGAVV